MWNAIKLGGIYKIFEFIQLLNINEWVYGKSTLIILLTLLINSFYRAFIKYIGGVVEGFCKGYEIF